MRGHGRRVSAVAFSPDSKRMLTGGNGFLQHGWGSRPWESNWSDGDHTARLWETSSGRVLQTFPGHKPDVRGVVFSRDGRLAASCGGWKQYQHIDVYEVASGRVIHELKPPATDDHVAAAVTFIADMSQLRASSQNGTIQTWSLETEKELPIIRLRTLKPQPNEFPGLLFTSDGARLFTGNQAGAVELWTIKTGARAKLYAGHGDQIRGLARSADDRLMLSGSADNTARLWDVESGKQVQIFDVHGRWPGGAVRSHPTAAAL